MSEQSSHPRRDRALNLVALFARWLMGALFIYMGLNKALHPVEFLKLVRQYDLVADPLLLNLIAAGLPWFEVLCGLLLVLGIAVRGSALILVAMLVPFTLMVWQRAVAIQQGLKVPFCSVRFDCGCGLGEVVICHKLVENTTLTLLCLWLALRRSSLACLRHDLIASAPGPCVSESAATR